ncbi:MAG: ATP12 family protein [Pseudomonadota bacterium]
MKRFYQNAHVAPVEQGFAVLLDNKQIKTPAQNHLVVITQALASEIAREWNTQGEKINHAAMLLTKFANSAIDGVAIKMQDVREDIVSYAHTDLLLYRADEPQALRERQARGYDPILEWLRGQGINFASTVGVMPVQQRAESLEALRQSLKKYDAFSLAALSSITALTGSACLALAVAEDFLSPEAVWDAAHIDEDFQIEKWGRDEEATLRRANRWKEMDAACRMLALAREPA